MLKLLKSFKKRQGFTLTELIVVVTILGILAVVITPNVIDYVTDAKKSADEANKTTLQNAVNRYIARYGGLKDSNGNNLTKANVIVQCVKKEIPNIPKVQTNGMHFELNLKTGVVSIVDTLTTDDDHVELKE